MKTATELTPLDMIQLVISEWREGSYNTNLEAVLAETAWTDSVLRDLKINKVATD